MAYRCTRPKESQGAKSQEGGSQEAKKPRSRRRDPLQFDYLVKLVMTRRAYLFTARNGLTPYDSYNSRRKTKSRGSEAAKTKEQGTATLSQEKDKRGACVYGGRIKSYPDANTVGGILDPVQTSPCTRSGIIIQPVNQI